MPVEFAVLSLGLGAVTIAVAALVDAVARAGGSTASAPCATSPRSVGKHSRR
jgi:hypothetical protein